MILDDFEYAVRKSHGEGWDYVDGLTTEDGFKILQLLKKKEAKTVESIQICRNFYAELTGYCPSCKRPLKSQFNNCFCGNCGQKVKWE